LNCDLHSAKVISVQCFVKLFILLLPPSAGQRRILPYGSRKFFWLVSYPFTTIA